MASEMACVVYSVSSDYNPRNEADSKQFCGTQMMFLNEGLL